MDISISALTASFMLVAAVEVKTSLSVGDVNCHLDCIARLRRYMDERGDTREIIGAVAGGVAPDDVLEYAQQNGFFRTPPSPALSHGLRYQQFVWFVWWETVFSLVKFGRARRSLEFEFGIAAAPENLPLTFF